MLKDTDVIRIFATGLYAAMMDKAKERIDSCTAMGVVVSTVRADSDKVETWLIKYPANKPDFYIKSVETDKYPDGAILYWHDNDEDTVTQAALFGDGVTEDFGE